MMMPSEIVAICGDRLQILCRILTNFDPSGPYSCMYWQKLTEVRRCKPFVFRNTAGFGCTHPCNSSYFFDLNISIRSSSCFSDFSSEKQSDLVITFDSRYTISFTIHHFMRFICQLVATSMMVHLVWHIHPARALTEMAENPYQGYIILGKRSLFATSTSVHA